MTSHLLKQTQCPSCAKIGNDKSRNNLAIYSDGHEWCYRCGYYKGANGITKLVNSLQPIDNKGVYLPSDCDVSYPYKALQWVEQYELNRNDLLSTHTLWSEEEQRLIFPVFGDRESLIAFQGRWFGEGKAVKWYGKGNLKDTFNLLGRWQDKLVLVEDIISAIKVSKVVGCMPLYGSHIDFHRWKRLKLLLNQGVRVIIWLDKDKQREAIKYRKQGSLLGLDVDVLITDLDPKEYSLDKIKELLNG